MNKYLGGVQGIELDEKEMQNLINTEIALNNMTLPYTTCSMEGVGRKLLKGIEELKPIPFHKWRGRRIKTISFTSTSILRKTSYDKEVQMVILVPKI